MKKIFIFLIMIFGSFVFSICNVYADNSSFYEGNYIDGIYMNRVDGNITYYQKARFFNQSGTNRFAYCVEPFATMNESSIYTSSNSADNLNQYQIDRIKKIAYFGYGYDNHSDSKWYAIAQLMIWKVANPSNDFYFTSGLNGPRTNLYEAEINEINQLISNYETLPSFNNASYDLVEGENLSLIDSNGVLNGFSTDNPITSILNNQLVFNELEEGNYTINLKKGFQHFGIIPIFYNSYNSQNVMLVGDLSDINAKVNINVQKTGLEITKIDSDTKSTVSQGDASLIGAIYTLYDSNMNIIDDIVIDEDNKGYYNNLKYGKYYLKEKEAGSGYLLDTEVHEINISKEMPIIEISLENKVIKKEIKIYKKYGDNDNFSAESGISFNILNSKGEIVNTITTDNIGYASIILPYGKYTIKQVNTTSGYKHVDDIFIDIEDSEDEILNLFDYKIEVPNTGTNKANFDLYLLFILLGLLYGKKIIFC